jgi:hypothetical protein
LRDSAIGIAVTGRTLLSTLLVFLFNRYSARTAEAESATGIPAQSRAHYVTREFLHQLVWESPVSEVAARFGVTDVGLAKACRRAAIPIPARGYWARLEAGRRIDPAPLPAAPTQYLGKIRIKGRAKGPHCNRSVDGTSARVLAAA